MEPVFIGNHTAIQKIRDLISLVSETAFPVLLLGETGTGKEVVARLLHRASSRRSRRFVKVNCASLPLTLLESELFGYEKGAFTGADNPKPGKFELASGGVIFLDEIGDMPPVLQAKLLQVLQGGEFCRLGGTVDRKVDAWVIGSTNHNLEKDMKAGFFREDLYYRINVIRIELPPLRERKEDIDLLTRHFIGKLAGDGIDSKGFTLDEVLVKAFQQYDWPGNVRELSSVILRLAVGEDPDIVQQALVGNKGGDEAFTAIGANGKATEHEGAPHNPWTSNSLKEIKEQAARYVERKAILHALQVSEGNKRKAAEMLNVSYKTLFSKINNLNIPSQR